MSYHLNISKLLLLIIPQEESVSHFITTRMINLFGTEVQNVEFFLKCIILLVLYLLYYDPENELSILGTNMSSA